MGKIYSQTINNFSRGITNDVRVSDTRYAQMIKSFDAHTYAHKLVPFRSSESGDSAASTSQKQAFAIALRSAGVYKLFGLGVISGTARAEVLMKSLSTGGSSDLGDNGWDTPSNNQSSAGSTSFNLFVYYAKTALIYGARAGTNIWAFDPTSAAVWADSHQALTYTKIAQGLVHSKDDILYIPYDNKIAKNNNGSWTVAALTLPTHFYITSICEYGNYLAIACAPLSGFGKSVVYLWDRDATLTTLSESIDWGNGVLQILEEINGYLIGISFVGSSSTALKAKLIFKRYSGGSPVIFQELESETTFTTSDFPIFKQKENKALYFLLSIKMGGVTHQGLWKVAQNPDGNFLVTMDRNPNNDTALTSGTLQGFIIVGDYVFISYVDSSVYVLSKTDNSANYNVSATYESLKLGNLRQNKKLRVAGVMTEAMPTAGQIILKYKKDEETSWTTIFTNTTDNNMYHEALNIESSGAELPQFREIQFQILSTGNAVVTGLYYSWEDINDNPSD